jgi:beta-glucanase (GH16 family)
MPRKFSIICIIFILFTMSCNLFDDNENDNGSISTEAQFEDDFNDEQINESVWQIATWVEHDGQTGRGRCYSENGYLNLVFINDSAEGYLSSAIQTREEFLYGRWEARLKPSSVPGVLNSMYTIDWDDGDGTKQEIDIEFLTYTFADNSGEVHFAVHADGLNSFNTNPDIELDFNPSDDFHVWGFEITPLYVQWFVDDLILLTYTYSENDIVIDSEYQLKFNFWSQENWINGPPVENTECIYQIDWIRFYPYVNEN